MEAAIALSCARVEAGSTADLTSRSLNSDSVIGVWLGIIVKVTRGSNLSRSLYNGTV